MAFQSLHQELADRFTNALEKLETHGEADELLDLFSSKCEIDSQALRNVLQGTDGARRFWKDYRDTFSEVQSKFRRLSEGGPLIVLEWESHGRLKSGKPFQYRGVSLLECSGSGNQIDRFVSYYDSRALQDSAKSPKTRSEAA